MRRLVIAAAFATLAATPALAALKVGAAAPDFTAQGFQAGKPISFSLAQARKAGPVVLYFFPAANTPGCNVEAALFSQADVDGGLIGGASLEAAGFLAIVAAAAQESV